MNRLEELVRTVGQMSNEELLEQIRTIRRERKVKAAKPVTARSREKTKGSIESLLAALSPEERAALLAKVSK